MVNGTIGHLYGIVWKLEDDPLTTLPQYILFVSPEGYQGPVLFRNDEGKVVIPVKPQARVWVDDGTQHTRKMLPVALAYAITVHKSQSLTLERAVLDLAKADFALGLSYVAVSRVKTIASVMFVDEFSSARFKDDKKKDRRTMRTNDREYRESSHMVPASPPTQYFF